MAKANQNYLQLPGNYLFSTIAQKVRDYQESHPGTEVIRLGIGDVTQPIAPEIIRALHSAVDEMGQADTFRGYAPDLGYDFLREASKQRSGIGEMDYDRLSGKQSLREIISGAVENYRKLITDPQMFLFYKVILSERSINRAAAEIMVKETKTMINATKTLFYALQVKGLAQFENADVAAVSFAMSIHALLDYECDLEHAGMKKNEGLVQDYIAEFCRIYEEKGDKTHE